MDGEIWFEIGNQCLVLANDLLKKETAPTAETARAVRDLVETAVAIDSLNLQWAQQNRFFAGVRSGQTSARR